MDFAGEYEHLLAAPEYDFPDFGKYAGHDVLRHGNNGPAQGRVLQPSAAGVAPPRSSRRSGLHPEQGRFHGDDVYMPITPMFMSTLGAPWAATAAGVSRFIPGGTLPTSFLSSSRTEGVTFTHGVPTILQMLLSATEQADAERPVLA